MREVVGDLFAQAAHLFVIPTNGQIDAGGNAVMGRGVALQAKQRWPWIAVALGQHLRTHGNHVALIGCAVTFPTKHHWAQPSDIVLIKRSLIEMRQAVGANDRLVALPRLGCGEGGLDWTSVVRPLLLSRLPEDSWFVVHPT